MSLPVPPPMPAYTGMQFSDPGQPTKDECTMALLAHLLQVFSGFVGPLVIFLVRQDSKFVKYHALQSLIWQAAYMILGIGAMAIFFFMMIGSVVHTPPGVPHQPSQPPPAFVFFVPLIWVFWMGGWVVNLILGIVYGVKANRGEWAGYPLIGRILLREYNPAALSHPSAPQI
ncbi:MAG TPA: DUF4870 domain-containing protein [Candidatus Sulfotelmatobacter sp.]|nr:DUF4870 domain-containing protein [Candidatus Sulfotelmatobacter sp.]